MTDRPNGTLIGTLSPDGETIWWFADTDGDEFGVWMTQPFAGGPDTVAVPEVEPAYPAGLEVGRTLVGDRPLDRRRQRAVAGPRRRRGAGGLPAPGPRLGRRAHPGRRAAGHLALRARRPALPRPAGAADGRPRSTRRPSSRRSGTARAAGCTPWSSARCPDDRRLLVGHERRGREELLIWDVAADTETEIVLDLPGDVTAGFYPDGSALLVGHDHAARSEMYRYDLATGALEKLDTPPGVVRGATARPDGTVELAWSSSALPPVIRRADGPVVLSVADEEPPAAYPVEDRWVPGPGGDVHALLVRPEGPRPVRDGVPGARRPGGGRRRLLPRPPGGLRGRRVRGRARQLPRLHRLRQRPGGTRSPAGPGSPSWRTSPPSTTRCVAEGVVDPRAGAALRRLVGRVPHAARPGHPAGALGGGHRRGAGRRLPRRVRGRDGGPAGLRPGAVRRLTGGGARRVRALLADHLRRRGRRAGARGRRRQRPALPDPADRQLPGRASRSSARSTRSTGSTPATARWSSRRPSARSRSPWPSPCGT